MKIYTKIPSRLEPYYKEELKQAKMKFGQDVKKSWRHLEKTHIIGQPYPRAHTLAHWEMLKFGIPVKNYTKTLGQFPRLLSGGIKSFVGEIPVGNTGGVHR